MFYYFAVGITVGRLPRAEAFIRRQMLNLKQHNGVYVYVVAHDWGVYMRL